MKEIEFNLLDEPWIRVRDDSCQVHEVSLTDALLHAHQYTSLSGELPTQDIVVACHAKRKKLTRKTKKTLLNTTFKSVFYYL